MESLIKYLNKAFISYKILVSRDYNIYYNFLFV